MTWIFWLLLPSIVVAALGLCVYHHSKWYDCLTEEQKDQHWQDSQW